MREGNDLPLVVPEEWRQGSWLPLAPLLLTTTSYVRDCLAVITIIVSWAPLCVTHALAFRFDLLITALEVNGQTYRIAVVVIIIITTTTTSLGLTSH